MSSQSAIAICSASSLLSPPLSARRGRVPIVKVLGLCETKPLVKLRQFRP